MTYKDINFQNAKNHCHVTGKYRGTVQSIFNSRYEILWNVPKIRYNKSTHDFHLVIKDLSDKFAQSDFVSLDKKNTEKYIRFSVMMNKYEVKINANHMKKLKGLSNTRQNLLVVPDLYQPLYLILQRIFQRKKT